MRKSADVRRVAGDFKRLTPIDESEFILRLLKRPEFKGEKGERGEPGAPGAAGERGLPGVEGKIGLPGPSGKDGRDGRDGKDGKRGSDGKDGKSGRDGKDGKRGERGDRGERGGVGPRGPKGDPGPKGDRGDTGPMPKHEWDKTKLRFELPNKKWGPWVDLKGNQVVYQMGSTQVAPPVTTDGLWEKQTFTINAGASQVVASKAMADLRHGEFIVNIRSSVDAKEKSLKIAVVNDESNLKDQVYARAGSPLDVDVQSQISGSDFNLVLTNNESFSVSVIVAKLIL